MKKAIYFIITFALILFSPFTNVYAQSSPTSAGTSDASPVSPENLSDPLENIEEREEALPGYLITCPGAIWVDQDGDGIQDKDSDTIECGPSDLIVLIEKGINFAIFIALIISTLLFLYAGFTYMISSDKADRTSHARKMIKMTLLGLLIVLSAWILIKTTMQILGLKTEYNALENIKENATPASD